MGRGKDGYTSLLIEEEGGTAKEIVSEENGVLISTILRQYFMSLKVLGKWKRWGPSMNRKFGNLQEKLEQGSCHSFVQPKAGSKPPSPVAVKNPHIDRLKQSDTPSGSETDPDSDENEDDGADYDENNSPIIRFSEREEMVIRKVMRKWWRLAGLKGRPDLCDMLDGEELEVNWTKAIAPRLEGRIREGKKET